LVVVREYSQTVTTEYRSWGRFDSDGTIDVQDDEQTEVSEHQTDIDYDQSYVECERCDVILSDHPLSTIDEDHAERIMAYEAAKKRKAVA